MRDNCSLCAQRVTRTCVAGGEIGWFPCQYVERRGAAASRNSLNSSSNACSRIADAAAIHAPGDGMQEAARPVSELELPLHAMLSQVAVPSAAALETITGDDLESDVAELIAAIQKRNSPLTRGSSVSSMVPSPPSSNSRGSIDRLLLLSVVGPACSVTQTALAPSPPPAAKGDGERVDLIGDAPDGGAVESSVDQHGSLAAAHVAPVSAASEAAAEVGHAAAADHPPAARIALEFKWMLWTGSAYEPFSNVAHDLIERSMRAFEMRVVIDLSTGQGQREGFDSGHGLKLFVNPVGRTAYFYDEATRKKVSLTLQQSLLSNAT
jgi:hypothetical protein